MGKKNFEGPTFYRRGGHMRPGPGCQAKRVAYGVASGGAPAGAGCAGCTKKRDFGKKDCAI